VTPRARTRLSPRQRLNRRFLAIGAVGIVVIAVLVFLEVRSIREAARAWEETPQAAPPPRVRLEVRQREGTGVPGHYLLLVDGLRWELDTPAADADAAAWDAWAKASAPRWAALEEELTALGRDDPTARAEIFAPFVDDPSGAPKAFLLRLLEVLGRAGILQVDVPAWDD